MFSQSQHLPLFVEPNVRAYAELVTTLVPLICESVMLRNLKLSLK